MLYDHRYYRVRFGTLQKQLSLYEEFGWTVQRKYLGDPLAFLVTETGDVNSYIHIWQYNDATERVVKRARLGQDAAWQAYLGKAAEAGYIISQKTSLLNSAPFFRT
ncbi:MAG: NIPSNAP family protein [Afipia sp.]|nr:NIPSNAP family protein [Afipia sp.]